MSRFKSLVQIDEGHSGCLIPAVGFSTVSYVTNKRFIGECVVYLM